MIRLQNIILVMVALLFSACEDKGFGTQDITVVPSVTSTQDITIVGAIPRDQGDIAQRAFLNVAFSSYIDEASVTTSHISLHDLNTSADLNISFKVIRNFVFIQPLESLVVTHHYQLHMNGLKDIFDNSLAQAYTLSYICKSDFWQDVVAGDINMMAKSKAGDLYIWGSNAPLPVDIKEGDSVFLTIEMPLPLPHTQYAKSYATGESGLAMVSSLSELVVFGNNAYSDLDERVYRAVGSGKEHNVLLKEDGTIYSWGSNTYGQLGNFKLFDKGEPDQEFSESKDWNAISTRENFTLALKTNGSLWGWGDNGEGELGSIYPKIFQPILLDTNGTNITIWDDMSAGGNHSVALGNDGSIWSWGKNASGELGDGTFEQSRTAKQEALNANWRALSAGYDHTVAIENNGTLWGWGNNSFGQLGNDSTINQNVPVQEDSKSTTWKAVAAGTNCTFGIKEDGTLWAWGSNVAYRLGLDASIMATEVPVEVK